MLYNVYKILEIIHNIDRTRGALAWCPTLRKGHQASAPCNRPKSQRRSQSKAKTKTNQLM